MWYCGWDRGLPNSRYVDFTNPAVTRNFGVPVKGCDAVWQQAGSALVGRHRAGGHADEPPVRVTVPARSIFDACPLTVTGTGSCWRTAASASAATRRLLARCADLLAPQGVIVLETDPPGTGLRHVQVCMESASGITSAWFPWAHLGDDDVDSVADLAGLKMPSSGASTPACSPRSPAPTR